MTDGLSRPGTKAGRLQRALLDLWREHKEKDALPTSGRFLFYELEGRGVIPKAYRHADGTEKARKPSTDVSDALMVLREKGLVPWEDIADETRSLTEWRYADSVHAYVQASVDRARIDLWGGETPPLILCESRSLEGTLKDTAYLYLAGITATNGQTGGHLHTEVAPAVEGGRRVIYLGDLDYAGRGIEENTRRVLEEYGELEWERLAITDVQVREYGLTVISKPDHRFKPVRHFGAVETEALSQGVIRRLVTDRLDAMLPEPLEAIRERERKQRRGVRRLLREGGHE